MHVSVPSRLSARDASEVRGIVHTACASAGVALPDVEVHVGALGRPVRWWFDVDAVVVEPGAVSFLVDGQRVRLAAEALRGFSGHRVGHRTRIVTRRRKDADRVAEPLGVDVERQQTWRRRGMSGRTYAGVPRVANVRPGVRWLVTLKIPVPLAAADWYPLRQRYRVTAPEVTFTTWQEELSHLVLHEACHVVQMRGGQPRSEVEAEQFACAFGPLLRWYAAA